MRHLLIRVMSSCSKNNPCYRELSDGIYIEINKFAVSYSNDKVNELIKLMANMMIFYFLKG